MKVLVTGAAGELGRRVCRLLHEKGYELRTTDVVYSRDLPVPPIVVNLLTPERCYDLTEGMDAVVHLGNHANPHAGTAQMVFGENVRMNMHVFAAALETGVKKIVFASSIHVTRSEYNPTNGIPTALQYLPLDADHPQNPGNAYGLSKVAGENILQAMTRFGGLASAIAIRFPHILHREWFAQRRERAVPLSGVHPQTRLDELFAWLSSGDAASLVEAVLRLELPGYRVYAPAHPRPRIAATPQEIISRFYPKLQLRKPLEQIDALLDNSRITAETGWQPRENFWEVAIV